MYVPDETDPVAYQMDQDLATLGLPRPASLRDLPWKAGGAICARPGRRVATVPHPDSLWRHPTGNIGHCLGVSDGDRRKQAFTRPVGTRWPL